MDDAACEEGGKIPHRLSPTSTEHTSRCHRIYSPKLWEKFQNAIQLWRVWSNLHHEQNTPQVPSRCWNGPSDCLSLRGQIQQAIPFNFWRQLHSNVCFHKSLRKGRTNQRQQPALSGTELRIDTPMSLFTNQSASSSTTSLFRTPGMYPK